MKLSARYLAYCPNCGGPILEERLKEGLACEVCQPDPDHVSRPGRLAEIAALRQQVEAWARFFEDVVGSRPWPLQRAWATRVAARTSFAMLAPTGIGKTTFGLVTALWLSRQGQRCYLIFPTRVLVDQAFQRLRSWGADVVAYRGKPQEKEAILAGRNRISVFTVQFLYTNHAALPRPVDFLFVDDVDSLLKAARNVGHVLALLGFDESAIEAGMHLIRLRRQDPEGAEAESQRLRSQAQGVLAVASATARPRSSRVLLFRELLGFEVAVPQVALRKVMDVFEPHFGADREALFAAAVNWMQRLGDGGLIFLPGDWPKETVGALQAYVTQQGLAALTYEDKGAIERFRRREVHYLIGIASWRNPLARGLDLPERVRYALFVGVPKLRLALHEMDNPEALLRIGVVLLPLLRNTPLAREIRRLARRRTQTAALEKVARAIASRLEDPEFRQAVEAHPQVGLRFENGNPVLVFPDVTGYLQASGRTSRLTAAGLTRGVAVLLAEDEKAHYGLMHRLEYLLEEPPKPATEVNLAQVLAEVDEDRERLRRGERRGLEMTSVAVVVESPNKARTLAGFFGRPLRRFLPGLIAYEVLNEQYHITVTATRGHVTDLALEGGLFGVETDGGFHPRYHPLRRCPEGSRPAMVCRDGRPSRPDRDVALRSLQQLAVEVEKVYIATDPDTEGEKIAWDVYLALRPITPHIYRAEFHAVTPREFRHALTAPRAMAESLVAAQKVRRVADRWVGFSLSQLLQQAFGRPTLSAGRVQTPVLGWILDRTAQAQRREPVTQVEVDGIRLRFPGTVKASTLVVERGHPREEDREPPPPLTTDTLLSEASRAGFSVRQAMQLARDLFEAGHITYHRTDSTRISPEGMALGKRWVSEVYGERYARPRPWGHEGAHEAIRPTRFFTPEDLQEAIWLGTADLTEAHVRLYRIIVSRFLASQMIPARVRVAFFRFRLGSAVQEQELVTDLVEPGFTLAWPRLSVVTLQPGTYPVMPKVVGVPSALPFTEGELVAMMKARGLGRPSTYAVIVERLLDRRYVVRRGRYLVPTRLGREAYRYLTEESEVADLVRPYVSEAFTRELEALMDAVEAGQEDPERVLRTLHEAVVAILRASGLGVEALSTTQAVVENE